MSDFIQCDRNQIRLLSLIDFEVFEVLPVADSGLSADVHAKSEVTDSVKVEEER